MDLILFGVLVYLIIFLGYIIYNGYKRYMYARKEEKELWKVPEDYNPDPEYNDGSYGPNKSVILQTDISIDEELDILLGHHVNIPPKDNLVKVTSPIRDDEYIRLQGVLDKIDSVRSPKDKST